MSIPCKFERSTLSYDEHEIVLRSHHPEIYDASLDDLKSLRQRLREMRDKECTLAREKRRAVRGKGAQRGASFLGTAEHPLQRKQVFAAALKRVSKEIRRLHKLEARTAHVEAARRALAMRRAAQFPARPPTGDTPSEGMRPLPSRRRRTRVPRPRSEACRKRQKTRKRGATPATALSSSQGEIAMFSFAEGFTFRNFQSRSFGNRDE
jgi:hypothetical protein